MPVGLLLLGDSFTLAFSGFPTGGPASDEEQEASNWLVVAGLGVIVSAVVVIVTLAKRVLRLTALAASAQAVFAVLALHWGRIANSLIEQSSRNDTAVLAIYAVPLASAILALVWAARFYRTG